ncbi:MAG: ATP-binding cassette domain-containing protein [Fimbriiglobus sp.]|nr:ATP-binding cassette domain-containing protein [Fimbriiglobus sp.]
MLFSFRSATITRDGTPVLRDLSWAVPTAEGWAVVGPSGSGKSTLLEAVAGKQRVTAGEFVPPPNVRLVPFRETSRLFSPERFYYQQRFEFADDAECPTVREYLTTGQAATEDEVNAVAERMRIGQLLDLRMLKLSNGQTRRTRLARGLLARPPLLILDDPFSGLDVAGRAELSELLTSLVQSGQGVLLACRIEDVPAGFRVFELHGSPRPEVEQDSNPLPFKSRQNPATPQTLIDLRGVSVRHGGKLILDDITWTVREGERWAVLGPNGSGKTTLLSLICGDHPQAFANHVRVFGKPRGEETLWELKRRIGLVSPELHACFPRMRTALNAAATGFDGHLTPTPHTPEQLAAVQALFAEFGLSDIAARPWWTLSVGTQRAVLFVRAVAAMPPLVILDEPFQGMDATQVNRLRNWLDTNLHPSQTLLMVTHRADELPACVTHRLTLADGRVVGP